MFGALADILEDADPHISRLAAESMLATYVSTKAKELADAFANVKRSRSFSAVVDAFIHRKYANVTALRNCAEALACAMLEQQRLPSPCLRLTLSMAGPPDILTFIEKMDNTGLLHPGAVETNLGSWSKAVSSLPQQDVSVLESNLRLSQSAGLRRLGLALLIEVTDQHGWSDEHRECLENYCADTELWISEPAGLVEPPQSLEVSLCT
jgi:hypothetical protein